MPIDVARSHSPTADHAVNTRYSGAIVAAKADENVYANAVDLKHIDAISEQIVEQRSTLLIGQTTDLSVPASDALPARESFFCHDALNDPNTLKQIYIKRPKAGQQLVKNLKNTLPPGSASATAYRKEQKGPVWQRDADEAFKSLSDHNITFESRESKKYKDEKSESNPDFKGTFTYYGKAAKFYNSGDTTKIRMRIRYYIQGMSDGGTGEAVAVQRSKITRDVGYVELKIKNPRGGEEGYVDKYRMTVPDPLVYRLINLNAESENFEDDVSYLRKNILALNTDARPLNRPETVNAMLDTIRELVQQDKGFVKPHLAITYAREGYSLKEHYPMSSYSKKGFFACLNPCSSKFVIEQITREIEYQLTVDRNISAHKPLLPVSENDPMPITEHFESNNNTQVCRYPSDIRVMEFKQPKPMADLSRTSQSETQRKLFQYLVDLLKSKRAWGSFEVQTGKYGTFRAHLQNVCSNQVLERVG